MGLPNTIMNIHTTKLFMTNINYSVMTLRHSVSNPST